MRSGDDREGLDMEVVLRWCPAASELSPSKRGATKS